MASIAQVSQSVKGLVIPIPAVFDGKGEPDLPTMEKLTDWYLDAGVHGFFILGSQGQGPAGASRSKDCGSEASPSKNIPAGRPSRSARSIRSFMKTP
jgi:hypothetical protein